MRREGAGVVEESSSPSALDSSDDVHKGERSNAIGRDASEDGTPVHDEPMDSDALDPPAPPPLELNGPWDKECDKEGMRERDDRGEEQRDRRRHAGSKEGRGTEREDKPRIEAGRDTHGPPSGLGKSPDSRYERKRRRKEEERERGEKERRPTDEMHHNKSLKTEHTESEETKSAPKLLCKDNQQKEKRARGSSWPLAAKAVWEGGVTVKTPRKISININLCGRKEEEEKKTNKGEVVGVSGRTEEEGEEEKNKKTGEREEAKDKIRGGEVEESKREASREQEASLEEMTKAYKVERGEKMGRASREEEEEGGKQREDGGDKDLRGRETVGGGEEKEEAEEENFDLWRSAFGGEKDGANRNKRRGEKEEDGKKKRRTSRGEQEMREKKRTGSGEEEVGERRREGRRREMADQMRPTKGGEEEEGGEKRRKESRGEIELSKQRWEEVEGGKRRKTSRGEDIAHPIRKTRGEEEEEGEKRRKESRGVEMAHPMRQTREEEEEEGGEMRRRPSEGEEVELSKRRGDEVEGGKRRRASRGEEVLRAKAEWSRTKSHHRVLVPDGSTNIVDYTRSVHHGSMLASLHIYFLGYFDEDEDDFMS